MNDRMIATPYAGITRVRFNGYNLSRISLRVPNPVFDWQPGCPAPLKKTYYNHGQKANCLIWEIGFSPDVIKSP